MRARTSTRWHPFTPSLPSLSLVLILPPPPRPTLFPYTTLFRSTPRPQLDGRGPDHPVPHPAGKYAGEPRQLAHGQTIDRKSTRLNSSHVAISYAVFCLKKKKRQNITESRSGERVTGKTTMETRR